jgi:hypothetical protein
VQEPLFAHAIILEQARKTKSPLALLAFDLAMYFDRIQLGPLEVILRAKGANQAFINHIHGLYDASTFRILTAHGLTGTPVSRNIGVHQGSPFSCLVALLMLEPYHRAVEDLMQSDVKRADIIHHVTTHQDVDETTLGVAALPVGYCDDQEVYSSSVAGMQRFVN